MVRLPLITGLLACLTPLSLTAQLARTSVSQDAPRVLVAPFQRDAGDSALSVLVAEALRNRLRSNDRFNTVSREAMNATLRESDYRVDVPLGQMEVRQLASHMNARYIVEGLLVRRGSDSVLVVARLTERVGSNPQSVNVAIVEEAARIATSVSGELASRLATGFRSFADVEECRRHLGERSYARALRKAEDALRDSESNPAAHLCIADVVQALGASVDSVTAVLARAHEADTLNVPAMRRLAARYEAAADTANLVVILKRLLATDTRDTPLRVSAVQLLVRVGRLPEAVELINEGLLANPVSPDLLTLRMIAHGATGQWDSAAVVGEIVSGMDGARVDSLFVNRMIGYYRQAGDTTGWLRWLETGSRVVPSQAELLYPISAIRMVRGDTAGALAAARTLAAREVPPALEGRALFILASIQSARGESDSAVANARAAVELDSSLGSSLAPVYLRAGQRAFQDSAWAEAAVLFAQARAITSGRTTVMAAYYEGVSHFQHGRALDAAAESLRDCDQARQAASAWDAAEQGIIAGAGQDRERASQLLQAVGAFRERAATMMRLYCR